MARTFLILSKNQSIKLTNPLPVQHKIFRAWNSLDPPTPSMWWFGDLPLLYGDLHFLGKFACLCEGLENSGSCEGFGKQIRSEPWPWDDLALLAKVGGRRGLISLPAAQVFSLAYWHRLQMTLIKRRTVFPVVLLSVEWEKPASGKAASLFQSDFAQPKEIPVASQCLWTGFSSLDPLVLLKVPFVAFTWCPTKSKGPHNHAVWDG